MSFNLWRDRLARAIYYGILLLVLTPISMNFYANVYQAIQHGQFQSPSAAD